MVSIKIGVISGPINSKRQVQLFTFTYHTLCDMVRSTQTQFK